MTTERSSPGYDFEWGDEDDLPVARIHGGKGHPHAHHPVAGWRLKANVYMDGTVRLFSGEFGSRFFNPAPFHPGARKTRLLFSERMVEIDFNRDEAQRWLGIGRFSARLKCPTGALIQDVVLPHLHSRELLQHGQSSSPFPGRMVEPLHGARRN
ncbi:MAG: hypothetical protein HY360_01150 [Verrucomicrobia bacterium]|nr:hypothetical protein [Verrucomicrobiota bacterium]